MAEPFKEMFKQYLNDPDIRELILDIVKEHLQVEISFGDGKGTLIQEQKQISNNQFSATTEARAEQVTQQTSTPESVPHIETKTHTENILGIAKEESDSPEEALEDDCEQAPRKLFAVKAPRKGGFKKVSSDENMARYVFELTSDAEALFYPHPSEIRHPEMLDSPEKFIEGVFELIKPIEEKDTLIKLKEKGEAQLVGGEWKITKPARIETFFKKDKEGEDSKLNN